MGPVGHTLISSALGVGVGAATGSPEAGAVALGVGVLMDMDHLVDFYQWYVKGHPNRVYVLLHAWEYSAFGVVALAWIYFHPLVLAVVLAQLLHVATDHFHNRISPYGYFITYRILNRFDAAVITPGISGIYSYRSWPMLLPFGSRLRPWFQRRIEPWFEVRVQRAIAAGAVVSHMGPADAHRSGD